MQNPRRLTKEDIKTESKIGSDNLQAYLDKFENEDLDIQFKEYYFSNVIAKASKTMLDCSNSKIDIKKTGTEG